MKPMGQTILVLLMLSCMSLKAQTDTLTRKAGIGQNETDTSYIKSQLLPEEYKEFQS